ncbi:MAG: glycosyltransferase family 4 protein [Coriobacteriia bacterium]|nr:glycosyltransferase family 4 protein [Coriobacteriia bacterium]
MPARMRVVILPVHYNTPDLLIYSSRTPVRVALIADLPTGVAGGPYATSRRLAELLRATGDIELHTIHPAESSSGRPTRPAGGSVDGADMRQDLLDHPLPMRSRAELLRGFAPWSRVVHEALREIDPDVVHGQGTLHNGIAAVTWPGCPRVLTPHGSPFVDARHRYPIGANAVLRPFLTRSVERCVAGADVVANVTTDWRVNLPVEPHRSVHIPNPVGDPFFAETPAPRVPVVHYLGGDRRIKGGDILAEAWPTVAAAIPGVELRVYGAPHVAALSRGNTVRALPALDEPGVAEILRSGGVVVIPSRFEVSPLVIAEAWASMVPVVATAVGGIPAMAADAALLCTPSVRDLGDALIRALTDVSATGSLVTEGRMRAESHRGAAVAAAYLALYRELA